MDDPREAQKARQAAEARIRWQVTVNIAEQLSVFMTLRRKIRDGLKSRASPLAITAAQRSSHAR